MRALNILHVFRAPIGGLFRHVLDLAQGQIARGHRVGLIADSSTGDANANETLAQLAPRLALGLTRMPMPRHAGPGDVAALVRAARLIARSEADVVHGHGAKGGLYARLAIGGSPAVRAYTPHGGSLHYDWGSMLGVIYLGTERLLLSRGNLYLFESGYSAAMFRQKVGVPHGTMRVVHNGVTASEFVPVETAPDATDILFMGELRAIKGVDVLIDALALLRAQGKATTATLVGDGADAASLHAQTERLGLGSLVRFLPPMPARQAQALGRVMVVPSRHESLPYVVIEAAAAGKPLIATRVGGISEIYGPFSDALVPADDAPALATAMAATLADPAAAADRAQSLRSRVAREFTVDAMVDGVLAGYRAVFEVTVPEHRPALRTS